MAKSLRITRLASGSTLLIGVWGMAGCGSNAGDLLFQYGDAAATTALDQWLTALANDLAGTPLPPENPDQGGDDMTPGDGDGSGGEPPGLEGDASNGESLYTANGCSGCHCPNAVGGCGLSAPAIIGAPVDRIAGILEPASTHPVKPPLSEQDQADIAAFLASVAP